MTKERVTTSRQARSQAGQRDNPDAITGHDLLAKEVTKRKPTLATVRHAEMR